MKVFTQECEEKHVAHFSVVYFKLLYNHDIEDG